MSDGYIDNGEIAEFELDIELQLKKIRNQFIDGGYNLKKLKPLPRPKKMDGDRPVDRQYYHVPIEDQVAWIAVTNVLGPNLDKQMPAWSYGNRLYRASWYNDGDDPDNNGKMETGPYRHTTGNLYKKFQHSWPIFRRHVALTARTMVKPDDISSSDEAEKMALAIAETENLPYLQKGFWDSGLFKKNGTDIYHASIDLKQFYPNLNVNAVFNTLSESIGNEDLGVMQKILHDMLNFQTDMSGITKSNRENVSPKFSVKEFKGIPTGMFASGFLANAAMLPVDKEVNEHIIKMRSIAHFRFVDDHTILSYDFDQLCDWIEWYKNVLQKYDIGAQVNDEKYDPESLCRLISYKERCRIKERSPNAQRLKKLKTAAIIDTKIDGNNPTKLLTKTLAQVSTIAATNIDILDDEDLKDRLTLLEWLLLADIPEREIRPDTRAAFAAGQISALAPLLAQDANDLIESNRALINFKSQKPEYFSSAKKEEEFKEGLAILQKNYYELFSAHTATENQHLKRYFDLLVKAFEEFPGKSKLFFRLHQYCSLTGYKGLSRIQDWLQDTKKAGNNNWSDYYSGLSLQILAGSMLKSARSLLRNDALRSDQTAAYNHLSDIANLKTKELILSDKRQSWFHKVALNEFSVSILTTAELLKNLSKYKDLSEGLLKVANKISSLSFQDSSSVWLDTTGRSPGVWSYLVENVLSIDSTPSQIWNKFESTFDYNKIPDRRAVRRYPQTLSDRAWEYWIKPELKIKEIDSGWLLDAIGNRKKRANDIKDSNKRAFKRVERVLKSNKAGWISLYEWSELCYTEMSPFDPRRSEWTALAIVKNLVSQTLNWDTSQEILNWVHPKNILLKAAWKEEFPISKEQAGVTWEVWREYISKNNDFLHLKDTATCILDYRYVNATLKDLDWDQQLTGIGRLLLGLLSFNHSAPISWNFRGLEKIVSFPRHKIFQSLAISSPTFLLLESCLSARSSETRFIPKFPDLFGWNEGEEPNDSRFDPPTLAEPEDLVVAIENAQNILVENQFAVSLHQPRQLIPFQLKDFGQTSSNQNDDEDEDAVGEDANGQ